MPTWLLLEWNDGMAMWILAYQSPDLASVERRKEQSLMRPNHKYIIVGVTT